jgi:hypothetical protein
VISCRFVARGTLRLLCPRQDAEQILHMITDYNRDHISLGKLAGPVTNVTAAKTSRDLIEKRRVD